MSSSGIETKNRKSTIILPASSFCSVQCAKQHGDALRGEHCALHRCHSILVPKQLRSRWYQQAIQRLHMCTFYVYPGLTEG